MHGWGALDDSSIVHRFTDPGMSVPPEERESESSPVFHVAPHSTLAIATAECEYPNGLAFSPMNAHEEACCTMSIHARAYSSTPSMSTLTASLTNHRSFASLSSPKESVPNGMKVDVQGRVFCAAA